MDTHEQKDATGMDGAKDVTTAGRFRYGTKTCRSNLP